MSQMSFSFEIVLRPWENWGLVHFRRHATLFYWAPVYLSTISHMQTCWYHVKKKERKEVIANDGKLCVSLYGSVEVSSSSAPFFLLLWTTDDSQFYPHRSITFFFLGMQPVDRSTITHVTFQKDFFSFVWQLTIWFKLFQPNRMELPESLDTWFLRFFFSFTLIERKLIEEDAGTVIN